ncbi:MAG: class I adenylate-forming enzyme family protein [Nocardioidaceae bacterium]
MSPLTVAGLFTLAAHRTPESRALVEDGTTTTYQALAEGVRTAAHGLRTDAGLEPGDRVLVMAPNGSDFVTAVLACASTAAVFVPVSTQLTPRELAHLLTDCGPRMILHAAEYADVVRAAVAQAGAETPQVAELGGFVATPRSDLADDVDNRAEPDDLLYLGYTSGTTGAPKGARVTHRNRVRSLLLQAAEFGLGRDDTHLVVSPLYHTAPLTFTLLHLCLGGTVVVTPRFDAARVAGQLCTGEVTNSFMAPAALRRVLAELDEREPHHDLHAVIIGGAPCPGALKAAALRRLPDRLWEFYGATEVGVVTTLRPAEQAIRRDSAGRPIPGATVEVRDPGTARPLGRGDIGEVWVATATTCAGYVGVETAESADPLHHVGDLGFVDDDGFLHLVDRSADVIISGGANIYSREVEGVLESHPEVAEAAAFGVPDERWGEAVVAAVVLTGSAATAVDILEHCRPLLATYKRPREVVVRTELPRSQTGKLDKRRLRADFVSSRGAVAALSVREQ